MKKRKMLSSYTILFLIIAVVAVLTWFVPAGEYSTECNDSSATLEVIAETEVCVNESQLSSASLEDYNATASDILEEDYDGSGSVIDYEFVSNETTTKVYSEVEKNGQGIWQVLNAPVDGFYNAVDIALFVMVIGGFVGIIMETGAFDAGIGRILKAFKGREQFLIPILMILFGIGGTTFGMAEETIAFYPLIIPIILAAGYDVATGVMIILFGAGVGVLGSTVNPFAIGAASEAADIGIGNGIVERVILLVLVEAFAIFYTMRYAASVKKDPSKSVVADMREEHIEHFLHGKENNEAPEFKKGHGLILTIFALTFAVMITSVIPWEDFGIEWFITTTEAIGDIPFIGGVLVGNSGATPLGWWWFGEMTMLFLTSAVILGIYAKAKKLLNDKNPINVFIDGSRDLLGVALVVGLSRGIKIVMSAGAMSDTLLYYGSGVLENLSNVLFMILNFIFFIPMSFLIPSTSGLAGATMPIMGPMGELVTGSEVGTQLVITGYSAASGIVNLVTPTSGVVMGGLILAKVPYDRWLKAAVPVLIGTFIISVVVLSVTTIILI